MDNKLVKTQWETEHPSVYVEWHYSALSDEWHVLLLHNAAVNETRLALPVFRSIPLVKYIIGNEYLSNLLDDPVFLDELYNALFNQFIPPVDLRSPTESN